MIKKIIYENKTDYDYNTTISSINKNIVLPSTTIINRNDAEKIINKFKVRKICNLALKYLPCVFNQYTWKEINYFSNFTKQLLQTTPTNSILICPGCSPSKIIWLLNNIYKVNIDMYKYFDTSINEFVLKKLIIIQFPLSDLFSSSSLYKNDNDNNSDTDNTIDLLKLDLYIKNIMNQYMQYIKDDTDIYYIDLMLSGRTHKLLSQSIAKLNIKQQLQPINILSSNWPGKNDQELNTMYIIRTFCGSDIDRIISKYNVFNGTRRHYDCTAGNLSLLIFYIAYRYPSIINKKIKEIRMPKIEIGKIYEVYSIFNRNYVFKSTKITESFIESVFYSSNYGFYTGYVDFLTFKKLYKYENNINSDKYNGVIIKYNDKVIECDKLIKDNLLEFALAIGYTM